MIIESIKLKSPKNTNIFLVKSGDNEYILHSDIIVKYSIATNTEIDDEKFKQILEESDYLICLNKATDYIASRLKTTKQIKDYLFSKGFKSGIIKKVVDKLNEYGIINDEYYAKAFIKSNENKLSKKSIENKMILKGLKKEIFDEELSQIDDKELCLNLAKKFMKNKISSKENFEKMMRHLQYKGFNFDNISFALKTLKFEIEE